MTVRYEHDGEQLLMTLEDWQRIVKEINHANGWFEGSRTFGDDIALLHSEVSEAFEAFRDWGIVDKTREKCMHTHPGDDGDDSYCHPNHICKPEGVGSELADVLVRLLDTCERYNIDLEAELSRKLEYNKTRGYRHGGKKV